MTESILAYRGTPMSHDLRVIAGSDYRQSVEKAKADWLKERATLKAQGILPLNAPDDEMDLERAQQSYQEQWQESGRAAYMADAVASFGFGGKGLAELSPADAARCREVGVFALRAIQANWVTAALTHAVEACEEALDHELCQQAISGRPVSPEALTTAVLMAYVGLLAGRIVLPPETYRQITSGEAK